MPINQPGLNTEIVTVQHEGRRYRIERSRGLVGPGTMREIWPGRGVIGSLRPWLGDRHAKRASWYAAVNPTAGAHRALASVDDLPSRRAAIRWLLASCADLGLPEVSDA